MTALLLGLVAAVLPVISELTITAGKPAVAPGWAAVALAGAAACVGLDRYLGFSSGWMRFMTAEQQLARQRQAFEYAWNELLVPMRRRGHRAPSMCSVALAFERAVFKHELLRPARPPREGRGRPLSARCRIDPGSRPQADVHDRLAWP